MGNAAIDVRIERVANALNTLVTRLQQSGYEFARPASVLPGPEPTVDQNIRQIESAVGPVPNALSVFWRRIGSVDLRGSHPEWIGCEYPDPLVIYPSSEAVAELEEFVADREERLRYDFNYVIPISPDDYHKENVGGGMWYNVSCPATSADPLINDERHNVTFLDYLDLALKWGGFLGLDRSTDHNWPISQLAINVSSST